MKKYLIVVCFLISAIVLFNSCGTGSTKEKPASEKTTARVQYTCPMHPEVVSDKPGNCPKCGMALVEKKQ